MPLSQPFKSSGQASVALTTASVAVAIPGDGENVLIVNTTAVPVACDFQLATFAATASSPYIVPAGGRMVVTIGRVGAVFGAAFPIGTAAASVYFMRGDGSQY